MQITNIETIPVSIPLEEKIEMASATLTHRDLVIIRLSTDAGITGIGEFLTATYFSGETQTSAQSLIHDIFEPELLDEDPLNINSILMTMDELAQGNWFTKAAVEIALQDIKGKYYDAPLYELLGGRMHNQIEVAWHVGSAPPEKAMEEACRAVERGFDRIKLKVGEESFKHDYEMISSVREGVGPDVGIHLDANQAWSAPEAIRWIREFDAFNLEIVEQPVSWWDIKGLGDVVESCEVPILADESVFTGMDLAQHLFHGSYALPGVKVMKAGGLTGSMKLLHLSELTDTPVCLLGMPGETSIAGAAALHLASTVRELPFGSGIGPYYLKDDVVEEPLVPRNGTLAPPEGPGLGVEIQESKLDAYRST